MNISATASSLKSLFISWLEIHCSHQIDVGNFQYAVRTKRQILIYLHLFPLQLKNLHRSLLNLFILQYVLYAIFMEISCLDYWPYYLSWFSFHSFLNSRFSEIFQHFFCFVFIVTILIILFILFFQFNGLDWSLLVKHLNYEDIHK